MPYICMSRSDVPNGTVQVLDLFPNSSQRNLIYDGAGQTRYINRANTSACTNSGGAIYGATLGQDAIGLGAYLADTLDSDGAGTQLTTAQIASAVEDVMGLVDNALAVTAVSIIASIAGATYSGGVGVAGASVAANFSLENLLKVLAGAHYKIAKGTTLVHDSSQGAFVFHSKKTNLSSAETVTKSYDGDEFQVSLNDGHIAGLASAIKLYGRSSASDSTTGYPVRQHPSVKNLNPLTEASGRIVVVYGDDGSVLA
jgi:hypothetical protein